jgi:5-methylcytosine-specific restriction endonuclease McrA
VSPEVTPDWKPAARTKPPTKRGKPRTTPADWRKLHAAKGGPCRLCGRTPYELHHLLSRARGGPDTFWNLVPLCAQHHEKVTREDPVTLALLAESLTDQEYAGLVQTEGEGVLERLFGVPA